jgi:hypothetical protein
MKRFYAALGLIRVALLAQSVSALAMVERMMLMYGLSVER